MRVASRVLGREVTWPDDQVRTLALPRGDFRNDALICAQVEARLDTWRGDKDLLLVDLANPPSDDLPHFNVLVSVAMSLRSRWWNSSAKLAIILLPKALSPNDLVIRQLEAELDSGRLVLIDPYGKVHGSLPSKRRNLPEYVSALNEARESPYTLIRRRMIRRIGYFKERRGISSSVTRYFYDGRLCTSSIRHVLESSINFSSKSQILFYSPVADWMGEIARSIAERHGADAFNLPPILNALELGIAPEWKLTKEPVVLLPVVDSGKTMAIIDRALTTLRPGVRPRYIAIMKAATREEERGDDPERAIGSGFRSHSLRVDGRRYEFEYLLIVEQEHFTSETVPSSFVDHPGSSFDLTVEPVEFTSSAFWKMVEDAGWKSEDDVPAARSSNPLGSVPRFPELVEANGPLIAYKLHRLLSTSGRPLPVDPLIVRKAELGTQEVATSLVSMFDYSSIDIPPEDLEDVSLFSNNEPTPKLRERDWWMKLRSISTPRARAILLDEFRVEGGSLARLAELCSLAGVEVEAAAVLVDFGREHTKIANLPVKSLYRIPLLEDWA